MIKNTILLFSDFLALFAFTSAKVGLSQLYLQKRKKIKKFVSKKTPLKVVKQKQTTPDNFFFAPNILNTKNKKF